MKSSAVSYLTGISFIFLLPYLLTIAVNGFDTALLCRSLDMEDCLPVLVSGQISSDCEQEAIKAQTVIARSNLYRRLAEKESVREIFGELREGFYGIRWLWNFPGPVFEKAVAETDGQVLVFEDELKLVPYHELSSGKTRDGEEVFHDPSYGYLKSVDSSADKNSEDYLNSVYVAVSRMPRKLQVRGRDSAGYVTSLLADGDLLEGEAFCRGMGLSSSNFTIQKIGDEYRFLCKGRGHGLGFSQYGGNEMAKTGSTYQEIIAYYFPSMELTQVSGIFVKK